MTQEIIEMAQECGLIGMRPHLDGIYSEALVAFAKLVAEKALADHAMRETQRLGQEIEQEPVALHCCGYTDASTVKWNPFNRIVQCHNCGQTYTPSQRTWVGLTDEEIETIADKVANENFVGVVPNFRVRFARSIEQALNEENT